MSDLQVQKKAELLAAEALGDLEIVQGYVLTSEEDLHAAEDILKVVKSKLKMVKQENEISTAQLVAETKKLTAEKKRIDAWFKPAKDRYETMEARLKDMVARFVLAQEAERKQLAEQARAANTIQEKKELVSKVGAIKDVAHAKGVSTRIATSFAVVEPDAVPRELCIPSEDLIARAIESEVADGNLDEKRWLDRGVRIVPKVVTSVRV